MFDLTGRTALVTGAGKRIGAGIARCLAAQGAAVAVNDLVPERAAETTAAIEEMGGRTRTYVFDVTELDAVKEGVATIERDLGQVDILVNNVGNGGFRGGVEQFRFREMDPEQWDWYIDANLRSTFNCTHATINPMIDRGWGRIINLSSIGGVIGEPLGVSVYSATKGGINAFTRTLALEVGRLGVTVNAIATGLVGSPRSEGGRKMVEEMPVGRSGTPEDVGALAAYLASDEAAWMTGQTINLNGGSHTT